MGAFGLIFRNNYTEVLLIKRRDMPIWVLPGGCIEDGETPQDAAIREIEEETGFKTRILRNVAKYTHVKGDTSYSYECEITGGVKTLSNESKAIEFYSIDALPKMRHPHTPMYVADALLRENEMLVKNVEKLPFIFWLKALMHPYALFKYLLTRVGIHWNT